MTRSRCTSTPTTAAAPGRPLHICCSEDAGRIAVITGPLDQTSALDRLDGYCDALGIGVDEQRPGLWRRATSRAEGGERAMDGLLRPHPDLDAVFAGNDLMASGALRALRARGRTRAATTSRSSATTIWNPPPGRSPPLTTVRQDVEAMGGMMAGLLLRARLGGCQPAAAAAGSGGDSRRAGRTRLQLRTPARRRSPGCRPCTRARRSRDPVPCAPGPDVSGPRRQFVVDAEDLGHRGLLRRPGRRPGAARRGQRARRPGSASSAVDRGGEGVGVPVRDQHGAASPTSSGNAADRRWPPAAPRAQRLLRQQRTGPPSGAGAPRRPRRPAARRRRRGGPAAVRAASSCVDAPLQRGRARGPSPAMPSSGCGSRPRQARAAVSRVP